VPASAAPSTNPTIGGVTQFALPSGQQPFLARAASGRIWFVDQNNKLDALILSSRAVFSLAQLPNDTIIRNLAVGPNYVYAADSHGGLTVFSIPTEHATTYTLPFLAGGGMLLATSLDDRLWTARPGGDRIFAYDPRTRAVDVVEITDGSLTALAADDAGRIWFANDSRKSVGYYDTLSAKLVEFPIARRGRITTMLPTAGTLWAGTDTGELLAVRGNQLALSASAGAPVTSLVAGPGGAWYQASSAAGTVYASLAGGSGPRIAPRSAATLAFDSAGNAWLSDPSAGLFYVVGTGVQ